MKSLIINCLDKADEISDNLLNSFVEKLETLGSEVKSHTIRDLEVNPCFACTAQYTFEYGDKCRCEDDMNNLLPDFKEYNNWVFVSRIDKNGALIYLRNVLDRMEPLFQPISFLDNGFEFGGIPEQKANGNVLFLGIMDHQPDDFAMNLVEHIDSTALLFNKNYAATIFADINNLELSYNEINEKAPLLLNKSRRIIHEEVAWWILLI